MTPHIAGLQLEELRSLRNQVRCTWLRHEPLRFVTTLNRAYYREARVTFARRQTACEIAALLALAALMGLAVNGDYCALLQDEQSGTRKGCAASVRQQSRQRLRNSG